MPKTKVKSEERWTVVQVAAFLKLDYQTARNNMLSGDYGSSDYDAKSRKLTVLAEAVRSAKSRPKSPTKSSARKRRR